MMSCAGPTNRGLPSDVEWRSTHFVYHTRTDDPGACAAVLDQLERHFEVVRAATSFPWPEDRVIDYYKYIDFEDFRASSPCPVDSGGCVIDGSVHSPGPLHEHELIHAYFAPLGSPPRILVEGVASTLACLTGSYALSLPPDLEWDQEGSRGLAYIIGQTLVSHLVTTYGWQAFLDFYASAWQLRDAAEIEANFEHIYGESIDSAWASAIAGPEPTAGCVVASECSSPPLVTGTAEMPSYGCEGVPFRSLTVEEASVLEFESEGPTALLFECPAELGQPIVGFGASLGPRTFAELPRGRYFVVTDGETTLTTRSVDTRMFATQCEELPALALEELESGTSWLFQPAESPYFLRLSLPSRRQVTLVVRGAGPVQACHSCETSTDCVIVEGAAMFEAAPDLVLHFPAGAPQSARAELIVLAAPE